MRDMIKIWNSWQNFLLQEGESEYFPWLEELKYDPIRFLNKHKSFGTTDVLGKGNFRQVISPDKDSDVVVKILHFPPGTNFSINQFAYMNKAEKILGDEFPLLFPKVYAHDPKYSWIISQKLYSDGSFEMLSEGMETTFPDALRDARDFYRKSNLKHINDREIFRFMVLGVAYTSNKNILSGLEKTDERIPVIKSMGKIALRDEWFMQLAKAIHRYSVEVRDLKPDNMGLDKRSNLMILDASVFGEGTGEYKWKV